MSRSAVSHSTPDLARRRRKVLGCMIQMCDVFLGGPPEDFARRELEIAKARLVSACVGITRSDYARDDRHRHLRLLAWDVSRQIIDLRRNELARAAALTRVLDAILTELPGTLGRRAALRPGVPF